MKNLILTSLVTLTLSSQVSANEKGNGGDVVICDGKTRVLDSVIMLQEKYFDIQRNSNSEITIKKIIAHFKETFPTMAISLEGFVETFKSKGDSKQSIFWIKGDLNDIQDENLFIKVPANCSPTIKQAVVLVKKPFKRYYYNTEAVADLEGQGDELSWLLIHEWLREFVTDSDVIRIINAYLHSNQFLQESEEEVEDSLGRLGIKYNKGASFSEINELVDQFKNIYPKVNATIDETYRLLKEYQEQRKSFSIFNSLKKLRNQIYEKFNSAGENKLVFNGVLYNEAIDPKIRLQGQQILDRLKQLEKDITNVIYPR
ncbi:MAG: hypothetical protein AB7I27_02615 [Bacteriovoracaceae bacterium]